MKINKTLIALCTSAMSCALYAESSIQPIEPVLVTVPSGSFLMGDEQGEDTKPVHKVTLPEFSLGKYEVTVKEFRRFIEATGYQAPSKCTHQLNNWFVDTKGGSWDDNFLNTSEFQPVNCIGWKAADAYTKWLAKETGKPYRLPSEAEWEYAARGGTTTKFYFGDDPEQTKVCDYENTADLAGENILQRDTNSSYVNFYNDKSNCVDHSGYASIVGMYKPNPFGLHDMVSNVVEFLADCYQDNYQGAPTDGSAWLAGKCESRATRGGSWHWNTFEISRRGGMPDDFVGGVEGFRVALDGTHSKVSKQTKYFVKELKTAQQSERARRNAMLPYPDPVTNLTINQQDVTGGSLVTLTWDKSKQDDVESYRVYRNAAAGNMFKLLASNLIETTFKDANVAGHIYEYTVVAVRRNQQSDYSNVVATLSSWVTVPGRIEAESAVKISGSSLARTSDVDGKYNLTGGGGIGADAEFVYQIDVEKAGEYMLEYRVAAPRDTKGFELYYQDKKLAEKTISKTGGYHDWQTQQGFNIYLEKGKNTLHLKSLDTNWKLNWLSVKPS